MRVGYLKARQQDMLESVHEDEVVDAKTRRPAATSPSVRLSLRTRDRVVEKFSKQRWKYAFGAPR